MKIWHISDTHGQHRQLVVPENLDLIIHSGDSTNSKFTDANEIEFRAFLNWFASLSATNKIYVAGNHDSYIARKGTEARSLFFEAGIYYLEDQEVEINGIKFYGSPWTPSYGQWSFMMDRGKIQTVWEKIPHDTDVLITHGPPKTILDLSYNPNDDLEFCGDRSLFNYVQRIKPKYHLFGHIHNCPNIENAGTRTIQNFKTTFVNSSVVTDRKFDSGPSSNGYLFDL